MWLTESFLFRNFSAFKTVTETSTEIFNAESIVYFEPYEIIYAVIKSIFIPFPLGDDGIYYFLRPTL